MAKILGTELRKKFEAGYLTSTYNRISRFTPETETPIAFGQLLKYGTSVGHYEVTDGSETSAAVIAGVSVYDQSRTGTTYPGGITSIPFGQYGDCLISGDVVVVVSPLTADADAIVEGAPAYLAADGMITPDALIAAVATVALPQFIFLGQIEVGADGSVLAAVRKLY